MRRFGPTLPTAAPQPVRLALCRLPSACGMDTAPLTLHASSGLPDLTHTTQILDTVAAAVARAIIEGSHEASPVTTSIGWARFGVMSHLRRAKRVTVKPDDEQPPQASGPKFQSLLKGLKAETVSLLSIRAQVLGEAAGLRIGLSATSGASESEAADAVTRRILSLAASLAAAGPDGSARTSEEMLWKAVLLGSAIISERDPEEALLDPSYAQLLTACVWGPIKSGRPGPMGRSVLGW